MVTQFKDLSTWREDTITIEGNEVYILDFIDTKPNMFYILNPNPAELKVAITNYPRENHYEFLVNKNSALPFGRPIGTGKLYILNTFNQPITIRVYSIADKFDLNVLKNFVVTLDNVELTAGSTIESFGEFASLPSGNNTIGRVMLEEDFTRDLRQHFDNINSDMDLIQQQMRTVNNSQLSANDTLTQILEKTGSGEGGSIDLSQLFNVSSEIHKQTHGSKLLTDTLQNLINANYYYASGDTLSSTDGSYKIRLEIDYNTNYCKIYNNSSLLGQVTCRQYNLVVINNIAYLKYADFLTLAKSKITGLTVDTEFKNVKDCTISEYEIKSFGGVLEHVERKIYDTSFSNNYKLDSNQIHTISRDIDVVDSVELPLLFNRIEHISLAGGTPEKSVYCYLYLDNVGKNKVYFNLAKQEIKNLNIPVYAIELNNMDSNTVYVTVVGGLS